ncbi:hypothetical protein CERSUDRAFT_121831 [Gelatoporia subvermispora B]|uniref:Uncharacterized protein n=1 Tax=Ceriporiopsis subvermispora (strain B) TaxID=914234 RepID=M2RM91_CERS8|nr:hypothetical protein CERSUDRAFT_121831 [Gelatoporia subvermispora B]
MPLWPVALWLAPLFNLLVLHLHPLLRDRVAMGPSLEHPSAARIRLIRVISQSARVAEHELRGFGSECSADMEQVRLIHRFRQRHNETPHSTVAISGRIYASHTVAITKYRATSSSDSDVPQRHKSVARTIFGHTLGRLGVDLVDWRRVLVMWLTAFPAVYSSFDSECGYCGVVRNSAKQIPKTKNRPSLGGKREHVAVPSECTRRDIVLLSTFRLPSRRLGTRAFFSEEQTNKMQMDARIGFSLGGVPRWHTKGLGQVLEERMKQDISLYDLIMKIRCACSLRWSIKLQTNVDNNKTLQRPMGLSASVNLDHTGPASSRWLYADMVAAYSATSSVSIFAGAGSTTANNFCDWLDGRNCGVTDHGLSRGAAQTVKPGPALVSHKETIQMYHVHDPDGSRKNGDSRTTICGRKPPLLGFTPFYINQGQGIERMNKLRRR